MSKVIKNVTAWVRAMVGPARITLPSAEAEPLPRETRLKILKILQAAQADKAKQEEGSGHQGKDSE
jgi:hypothetical protein